MNYLYDLPKSQSKEIDFYFILNQTTSECIHPLSIDLKLIRI